MHGVQAARLDRHDESTGLIAAPVEEVFAFVDDPARLAGHMTQQSWMMGGGRMHVQLDAARGQRPGSRIVMTGRAFGIDLELEEVIEERAPPTRKTWRTVGTPRLIVIGNYRMGCELTPQGEAAVLRIFIDYELPARCRWLGRLFGPAYARWCTRRMLLDARRHFGGRPGWE